MKISPEILMQGKTILVEKLYEPDSFENPELRTEFGRELHFRLKFAKRQILLIRCCFVRRK